MTRPKKEIELTRNHRITLRLTDTEFSIIETAAEQANLSLSEYMRTQILKGKVNIQLEIVADPPEMKKLISEFGKICNNLNQIARYFNQGGIISAEMRKEIKKCIGAIYEMKYEVMNMVIKFRGNN